MADISKIDNGTEYNLKDATARAGIESSKTLKSSVVTVNDAAPINAEDITVDITPVQDLHGYGKPWAGGGWKNKLRVVRQSGTTKGVTFTVYQDTLGNKLYFELDGTASADFDTWPFSDLNLPSGTSYYVTTGLAEEVTGFQFVVTPSYSGVKTSRVMNEAITTIYLNIKSGTVFNHLKVYPMVCLNSENDKSFAPYSNICPIEGRTGAELDRDKVYQLVEANNFSNSTVNGITLSYQGDGVFRVRGSLANALETRVSAPIIPFTIYDGSDSYIRLNNTYANTNITLEFYNSDAFVDNWMISPAYRDTLFAGMRGRRTDQITIWIHSSEYGTYLDFTFKVEIYSGSTDNHKEYTASFGETVYGGKWHVTDGGTDKTYASVVYSSVNGTGAGNTFTFNRPQNMNVDVSDTEVAHLISDKLKAYSISNVVFGGTIGIAVSRTSDVIYARFPSSYGTTTSDINAKLAVNPLQVCYELATPTTISTPKQNVPMLQGINTVYADCGETQLKYQPDNVIGELKGEIQKANSFVSKMALREGSGAKDFSYGGWSFRLYIYRSMGQISMSVERISASSVTEQAVVKTFNGESDYRAPEDLRPIFSLIQAATYTTPSGWALQVYLTDEGYIMFTGMAPAVGASAPTSSNWNLVEPWATHQQAKDLFNN